MRKQLFLMLIAIFALCPNLYAAPAMQRFTDIAQPDGAIIKARQQGDEFQHWTETKSGHTILRNPKTKYWDYAEQDAKGSLKASGYRVMDKGLAPAHIPPRLRPPRNKALEEYKQKSLNKFYQERLQRSSALSSSAPSSSSTSAPVRRGPSGTLGDWTPTPVAGDRKLLLVRINFSDHALVTSPSSWATTVFSLTDKSVARYYADNSFSALDVIPAEHSQTGSPAGVVTVSIAAAHPYPLGDNDPNEAYVDEPTIINLALAEAASVVNFSAFDTNLNGTLEKSELAIYFIYAGYEASGNTPPPSVWAHAWGNGGVTAGGLNVTDWALSGELNNDDRQQGMGVIAHELGHALCGLPDLYDTSYTNAGMGIFSLMAAGSWGGDIGEDKGTTPTYLDLWSREYLGWASPTEPGSTPALSVNPSLQATNSGYKLLTPTSSTEYFLLENRQPSGWDLGARNDLGAGWQGGLLLSHIDISAGTVGDNDINDYTATEGRQGVIPVQANSQSCDMALDYSCWGDAKTLFYAGNNVAWTPLTAPDSNYYDGTPTNFSLTAISLPGAAMTAAWSTIPVTLPPVIDDFESGNLTKLQWQTSGQGSWSVTANGYNSTYAAAAPATLNDDQSATLATTVVTGSGTVSFRYSVDSEPSWDFLIFSIDGVEKGRWSGLVDWARAVYPVTAGEHTFSWQYQKDPLTSSGLDTAWIDDFSFPMSYELSVLRIGNGNVTPDVGTLTWTGSTGSASYNDSTVVHLTAIADPGHSFIGWQGACSGSGSCIVTMNEAKSITANFALNATAVTLTPNLVSPQTTTSVISFNANATGGDGGNYEYRFWWRSTLAGSKWKIGREFSANAIWEWNPAALDLVAGSYYIQADTRHVGNPASREAIASLTYKLVFSPPTSINLTSNLMTPQSAGAAVTFTATPNGGDSGPYEYRFWWRSSVVGSIWAIGQDYSANNTWRWDTTSLDLAVGKYFIQVDIRHVGNKAKSEIKKSLTYELTPGIHLTSTLVSPQPTGSTITFTATAKGLDDGPYEYRFWWRSTIAGSTWTVGQAYSTNPTWDWNTATLGLSEGSYYLQIDTRHVGTTIRSEMIRSMTYILQ